MLSQQDKDGIESLLSQIHAIYQEAKQRPSGMVCDICGQGDYQAKNAVLKVRTAVHGFEHRPSESPSLCFRHFGGWAHSFNSFYKPAERSDEEINLHFALYLAKQLQKEKANV